MLLASIYFVDQILLHDDKEILSSHLVLEVHIRQSYLFCHTSLMKLLTIVSFPHDNLVNKIMLANDFQKYFHGLFQISFNVIILS